MMAALIAAVVGSLAPYSAAHIGPSVRENNRYLKLTLLGGRVRVLYTFYVGEVPGAQARRRMDENGDGVLQPAEAKAYANKVAETIAASLAVTVDGVATPVAWDSVDPGLGTATVNAGAFSIDMVAWLCLEPSKPKHAIVLFDHWTPPTPGETELRIEESPGVVARRAALGDDAPVSQLRARWVGTTPLDKLGLHLSFDVDAKEADLTPGRGCVETAAAETSPTTPSRTWMVIAGGLAAVALAGIGIAASKRARRRG